MPLRHSLLRLEVPALQSVDTGSVEDLFGMWSLFSKTSHAVEDGRRLENLSWRLWNRETFCCHRKSPLVPSKDAQSSSPDIPMPALSSSLDSMSSDSSDEQDCLATRSTPVTLPYACPELRQADRGHEKHITPVDLEKMVINIQETPDLKSHTAEFAASTPGIEARELSETSTSHELTQELSNFTLDPPNTTEEPSDSTTVHASSIPAEHANTLESSASTVETMDEKESQSFSSDTSSNTEMSTHSIVRGFVPGGAPSSYRSQTHLAVQPTPILKSLPRSQQGSQSKKKGAMFTIGTSSGEDESSLESHMFKSALSESLKRPSSLLSGPSSKKQTSFKDEVAIGRAAEHSPVFESDDEDEDISESAIEEEDDESSEWEDSEDQSAHSSVRDEPLFQRVDSRPNLTSRRSLLTTLMHEPDRARALANAASRSTPAMRRSRNTTPNGPSVATSPDVDALSENLPHPDGPTTAAKPIIMTTSNTHQGQLALSPRSTRRNMLTNELTESLRKHLLWERQHKSTTNLHAQRERMKRAQRSQTSTDVKNLKQHPEPVAMSGPSNNTTFTNDYFHAGLQEFHSKGW